MAENNKGTIVCQNIIEKVSIVLYSDNNKNHWQTMVLNNTETGAKREVRVAPVDFFTLASAIMCNDELWKFIDDCGESWTGEIISTMLC